MSHDEKTCRNCGERRSDKDTTQEHILSEYAPTFAKLAEDRPSDAPPGDRCPRHGAPRIIESAPLWKEGPPAPIGYECGADHLGQHPGPRSADAPPKLDANALAQAHINAAREELDNALDYLTGWCRAELKQRSAEAFPHEILNAAVQAVARHPKTTDEILRTFTKAMCDLAWNPGRERATDRQAAREYEEAFGETAAFCAGWSAAFDAVEGKGPGKVEEALPADGLFPAASKLIAVVEAGKALTALSWSRGISHARTATAMADLRIALGALDSSGDGEPK